VVTTFFERLGNLGVLLIAGAFLLGGMAGAAVAHHYDRLASDSVASQQHEDKGDHKQTKKNKQGKQNHGNKQHGQDDQGSAEQPEAPETD
jgi:hypothetical protein